MRHLLSLFFIFSLCACGAIFNGTEQTLKIHSSTDLENAEIKINGRVYTPVNGTITVAKKDDGLFVSVMKPGYYEKSQYLARKVNMLALSGDLLWLIGAPVALIIDFASTGIYEYEPADISLTMRQKD